MYYHDIYIPPTPKNLPNKKSSVSVCLFFLPYPSPQTKSTYGPHKKQLPENCFEAGRLKLDHYITHRFQGVEGAPPLAFDLFLSGQKSCFFFPLRPLPAESQPLDDSFKNVTHEKSALNLYSPRGPKFCLVFFSRGEKGWLEEMYDV